MKLEPTPPEVLINEPGGQHGRENQARANAGGRDIHFPDGNATIARLLVRSLVPDVIAGSTQEDVVTARANYARLGRDGSPVAIRLNSTAGNVQHAGDPPSAEAVVVADGNGGRTMRRRGAPRRA